MGIKRKGSKRATVPGHIFLKVYSLKALINAYNNNLRDVGFKLLSGWWTASYTAESGEEKKMQFYNLDEKDSNIMRYFPSGVRHRKSWDYQIYTWNELVAHHNWLDKQAEGVETFPCFLEYSVNVGSDRVPWTIWDKSINAVQHG